MTIVDTALRFFSLFRGLRFFPPTRVESGKSVDLRDVLSYDPETKTITVRGDLNILVDGNLQVSAKKHVMVESGGDPEPDRPGYNHSIWFNPVRDERGRPVDMSIKRPVESMGISFHDSGTCDCGGSCGCDGNCGDQCKCRPSQD